LVEDRANVPDELAFLGRKEHPPIPTIRRPRLLASARPCWSSMRMKRASF
jgi:hypothetical protein